MKNKFQFFWGRMRYSYDPSWINALNIVDCCFRCWYCSKLAQTGRNISLADGLYSQMGFSEVSLYPYLIIHDPLINVIMFFSFVLQVLCCFHRKDVFSMYKSSQCNISMKCDIFPKYGIVAVHNKRHLLDPAFSQYFSSR